MFFTNQCAPFGTSCSYFGTYQLFAILYHDFRRTPVRSDLARGAQHTAGRDRSNLCPVTSPDKNRERLIRVRFVLDIR